MRCNRCQAETPQGAGFCPACGSPLPSSTAGKRPQLRAHHNPAAARAILLAVVASVAVGAAAFVLPGRTPDQPVIAAPTVDARDWRSYDNVRFAFAVRYPPTWTVSETVDGAGIALSAPSPGVDVRVFASVADEAVDPLAAQRDDPAATVQPVTLDGGGSAEAVVTDRGGSVRFHMVVAAAGIGFHVLAVVPSDFYEERSEVILRLARSLQVDPDAPRPCARSADERACLSSALLRAGDIDDTWEPLPSAVEPSSLDAAETAFCDRPAGDVELEVSAGFTSSDGSMFVNHAIGRLADARGFLEEVSSLTRCRADAEHSRWDPGVGDASAGFRVARPDGVSYVAYVRFGAVVSAVSVEGDVVEEAFAKRLVGAAAAKIPRR